MTTHPAVAARRRACCLRLMGCVYWIETGAVAYTTGNERGGWDWVSLHPDD